MSFEDHFLKKLARGADIAQDEYAQMSQELPDEQLAAALVRRFQKTGEMPVLLEAARLYQRAGQAYAVLEICSRYPHKAEFRKMVQKNLPQVRQEYPGTQWVGKLLEEAFIVIDLQEGTIVRFPPLMPSGG